MMPTCLLIALLLFLSHIACVRALPLGFVDEGVTSFSSPMAATFVPNPRKAGQPMMIIVSKEGVFEVLENPDISDVKISGGSMTSIMCTNGSRGVFGIAPHPNFLTNPFIYVYYTRIANGCPADTVTGTKNRLSRFRMNPLTLQIILTSELVLLEDAPATYLHHDGGAMFIGNDRNIYLAIGDGGNILQAQDLKSLNGKIIRLGLNGAVPPKNPFTVASGGKGVNCRQNGGRPPLNATVDAVCEEIFAYGFRNPFRLGVDVNTKDRVRFAIADVGKDRWDEINYAGSDYRGRNYGWPTYEGPCIIDKFDNCPRQVGIQEPFYFFSYKPIGGAATGSVFVPNGVWPEQYKYMIVEHVEGLILNIIDDILGCRNCVPPRPGMRNQTFHKYERIVDIFFAPYQSTQAMYYISRKAVGQNVRRIRYIAGANLSPIAAITVSKTVFALNEVVTFSGSKSTDPNRDRLTFLWEFGDGRTSTLMNPTISFSTLGTKSIKLTVNDGKGLSANAFQTISVGKLPTAIMDSPVLGNQFAVGDIIRFRGRGTDQNSLQPINPTRIFWDVQILHAGHFHPFMTNRSGTDFDIPPAPGPEDFSAATNSNLHITMTVVDTNGLIRTIRRNIFPKKVFVDVGSNIPGLKVLIDDFVVTTPSTITAWQNQNLKVSVDDQPPYFFQSWNIGGPRITSFLVPPATTTNPIISANFRL